MKVYISGKIGEETPRPETLAKFRQAEEALRQRGFEVFNPTKSGLGAEAEINARSFDTDFYTEIMLLDLTQFRYCDAIYILEDYWTSPGAKVEIAFAKATSKQLLFEARKDAEYELEYKFSRMKPTESFLKYDNVKDFVNEHLNEIWIPTEKSSKSARSSIYTL